MIGTLQRLLESIRFVNPLLDQCLAVTGQLAYRSNRRWRNEARPQQSVSEQVGQPFAVADVRFLAWHRPHVLRVDEQQGALLVFKNVEYWPPVHASRLERHVGHSHAVEPVRQLQQVGRHCLECTHLSLDQPVRLRDQDAGDNTFLVDVEPTTPRVNDLHRHFLRPLSVTTAEREENTTFPHVLVSNGTATLRITGRTPRQLPLRALSTKQKHPMPRPPCQRTAQFHPHCRPPGHDASIATQRPASGG